ncbi:MAG: DUF4173 domain-containing protein [Ardenticatenaceae bacterium]|nr:DUF4173 domain-containing protein [Ardenticatenaceae bacterium]
MAIIKQPKRILLAGLALGWSVDLLFYGKQVGVSLLIFVLLLLAALWQIGRGEGVTAVRRNLWLIIPLLFFAGMAMIRANQFLTVMNVLTVLAILSYLAFFYAAGRVSGLGMAGALFLPVRVSGNSMAAAAPILSESMDVKMLGGYGRRSLFPLIRGALLALPVLVVFTLLLASADLIFADYVDRMLSLDFLPNIFEMVWRVILIGLSAWLLMGGLAYAIRRRDDENDIGLFETGLAGLVRTLPIGFVETMVVLGLVDLLFAAFTAVQFTYLFGGRDHIALEGITYAEYARSGFFELVWVAVLSLSLSLSLNWIARRESKRQIKWFNLLVSLLVGFVGVMLVSAVLRMRLYESTFGYTELRLMVYVFMGWLWLLLCWFVLTLWFGPHKFTIGFILAAIGFLATLNLINPDAFIARQNLARYLAANDLDAAYLTSLSDDAVPQLARALTLVKDDAQLVPLPVCVGVWRDYEWVTPQEDCEGTPYEILWDELNGRYQSMTENTNWRRWQSFHLAHWQAFAILTRVVGK